MPSPTASRFRGSYTALTTPFNNGRLDIKALEDQIKFQAANGTTGIVPVGTTGESPTLSHEEHHQVIELAVKFAKTAKTPDGKPMQVIAGTGSNATEEALDLHRFAKKVGADAALSVVPYYNKPHQYVLYQNFIKLAIVVDLPVILYNIPGRTGINMSNQTTLRLANDCPNIVGMKEATGSVDSCSELTRLTQHLEHFTILSGDDSLTLPMIAVGAQGVISVASNIVPRQIRQLVDAALANNYDEARELHLRHYDLFKALFLEGNPMGIKCAMQLLNRDTGDMRLPCYPVSAGTRTTLRTALFNLQLLQDNLA
jgi:4-hydroxy-tetrahydrodipicolinate synthase